LIRPREDCEPQALAAAVADQQRDVTGDRQTGPDEERPAWDLANLPPELEFFRTSEAYQVELPAFCGPLDLLLYLIQKDQIDIYDIPIARITDQYLQYLEIIQRLPLDNAGDFLVMAATLLRIKARLLLPASPEEELDEEDPRAELVRRLLEYKRFKEAADQLRQHAEERRRLHLRNSPYPFLGRDEVEPPLRLEMFDLLSALAGVLDRLTAPSVHTVQRELFTVEQKITLIRERLAGGETVRFEDLFADDAIKMEVIVTFIGLLEMVRQGFVTFLQTEVHGTIWLKLNEGAPAAPVASAPAVETAAEAEA